MALDLEKLKAAALAAQGDNPAKWMVCDVPKNEHWNAGRTIYNDYGRIADTEVLNPKALENAAYIAAAQPLAVLDLIAEIKRLRSLNADYVCIIKQQKAAS